MGDRASEDGLIRLFAAIVPDKAVVDAVFDLLGPCRQEGWAKGVRWLPRKNIHLTLRFFGDTLPGQREDLVKAVTGEVRDISPFDVALSSLIFLPQPRRTRVLAVSVRPDPSLEKLAGCLESTARLCGFEAEKRRFFGHLTVGRCKNLDLRGQEALCDFSKLSMRVTGVELVKSTLTHHGAEYQPLTTFSFLD